MAARQRLSGSRARTLCGALPPPAGAPAMRASPTGCRIPPACVGAGHDRPKSSGNRGRIRASTLCGAFPPLRGSYHSLAPAKWRRLSIVCVAAAIGRPAEAERTPGEHCSLLHSVWSINGALLTTGQSYFPYPIYRRWSPHRPCDGKSAPHPPQTPSDETEH